MIENPRIYSNLGYIQGFLVMRYTFMSPDPIWGAGQGNIYIDIHK